MALIVVPDPKGAMLAYLQASPDVTALCPPERITGNLHKITSPQYAIAVVKSGGLAPDVWGPTAYPRLDFHIYGSKPHDAMNLYRVVRSLLEPVDRFVGFSAAGCQVLDVHFEAEPTEMEDAHGWPKVWVPLILTVNEVPV